MPPTDAEAPDQSEPDETIVAAQEALVMVKEDDGGVIADANENE